MTVDGHPYDTSELDARLTPFYQSGERVEVVWKPGWEDITGYGARTDGRKARFYVGKSTGWKPIYLMLMTRASRGGGAVSSKGIESVRGLGIYRTR